MGSIKWGKRLVGIVLLLSGAIAVLSYSYRITGYVVSEGFMQNSFPILGILSIAVGLVLLSKLEKNLAQTTLESGRKVTKREELVRIARKCGYELKSAKEGYKVLKDGEPITVIPQHPDINPYTAKGILKSLSSGESSFRKFRGNYS